MMNKLLGCIFVFFICFCDGAQGKGSGMAKICYAPIGVETYVPITISNIESHCVRKLSIDIADASFKELMSLVDMAGVGLFEDGIVRVKFLLPDITTIYIDNEGGILKGSSQARLRAVELGKVKKILDRITDAPTK